jgi:hypothetical protein
MNYCQDTKVLEISDVEVLTWSGITAVVSDSAGKVFLADFNQLWEIKESIEHALYNIKKFYGPSCIFSWEVVE